jgi:asparagine synthase (glutamine-hydrolysing)
MCGIAGIYSKILLPNEREQSVYSMLKKLLHRGPDGGNVWSNSSVTLGHRRLAIQDLSENGLQPMKSRCNRYIIAFNGEIYNFKQLQSELSTNKWVGRSDTEVLVEAISEWGLDHTLKKINGMFAFSIWDETYKKLYLVRDRIGEKPLYFYNKNGFFAFSSEVKALECLRKISLTINRSAVRSFFKYGNIPWPASIYEEISKVAPGSYVCLDEQGMLQSNTYWSLDAQIIESKKHLITDDEEGIFITEKSISEAVKIRMISDVQFGAFLSGGNDSSLIAALMQSHSSKNINTFSIGFNDPTYNEAEVAGKVSTILGTNHYELYLSSEDMKNIIPTLGNVYCEPFADISQIPTILVSKLAKEHVTMAISGDGADELFCGYLRYKATVHIWNIIKLIPLRNQLANFLSIIPPNILSSLLFFLKPISIKYGREGQMANKVTRLIRLMHAKDKDELYELNFIHWENTEKLVLGDHFDTIRSKNSLFESFYEKMMYDDTLNYLEGDILQKVDRASMANSLEVRIPFLDINVIDTAWRLPIHMKRRGNVEKWILKQMLGHYLPDNLIYQKKRGFGVPIADWLRGELREWTQDLLSTDRLDRQGLLDSAIVQRALTAHLSGKENNSAQLWDVLMLQQWFDCDPNRESAL